MSYLLNIVMEYLDITPAIMELYNLLTCLTVRIQIKTVNVDRGEGWLDRYASRELPVRPQ